MASGSKAHNQCHGILINLSYTQEFSNTSIWCYELPGQEKGDMAHH